LFGWLRAILRLRAALERERVFVFKVIDRISSSPPNTAINEDAVGARATAAWAIDGATGVSERPPLVPGTTDAGWLAGDLNAALHAVFDDPEVDVGHALAAIEAKLQADFLAIDREPATPAGEQPTAALAVAALQGEALHLLGIGDCRIIYEWHTGEFGEFNPSAIGPAEALIVAERCRLLAQYPGEDPWPRLKVFIRPLRERANQEGGYSVVHPTRPWSKRLVRETREATAVRRLLLVSDGLYRLVDVFKAATAASLMQAAVTKGLSQLYTELRALEDADRDCSKYPRVKTYDDTSGILISLKG
jgi:serine/threonine protein phosphatase PrpC